MKTKLSQLWRNLGINAKAVLMSLGILLCIFAFFAVLLIGCIYPLHAIIILLTIFLIKLFQSIKQWLQQNKEN